jgi:hypothetical protein
VRSLLGIRVRCLLPFIASLVLAACGPALEPASLVLRHGKVVTVDAAKPLAQALAVRGDRIVAVGTNEEIAPYVSPTTEVIDLAGRLAIPGFIEGHGHFLGLGDAKLQLDLTGARSWEEIVTMTAEAVKTTPPGELIRGRGWHQSKWDHPPTPRVEDLPVHDALSAVSPNNPVVLEHASGHAVIVNAKAMALAGITRRTPNPPGGEIVKDAVGNPIGLLRETAVGLLTPSSGGGGGPALASARADNESLARRQAALAAQDVTSKGITSFQDAGASLGAIRFYKKLVDEGALPIRLWVMTSDDNAAIAAHPGDYRLDGYGDHRLTVRAIKRVFDGALGSHSAWLIEPYADLPSTRGLNTLPIDELRETARVAIEQGFQLCVHAIGDRANREALNVFEEAIKAHPDKKDLRWRVEHAQHLTAADIPRFGALGIIASMQGRHAPSDAVFVLERLGPARAEEGAYVWRKLLASGAVVINGTDAPIEDVNPLGSFYGSVTRKLKDGSTFYPDQRMTREEALRSYTLSAAYAAFEEQLKGSLTPGKLADITVLSKDIMTVPEDDIPSARVVYTIVGGKVVFAQ